MPDYKGTLVEAVQGLLDGKFTEIATEFARLKLSADGKSMYLDYRFDTRLAEIPLTGWVLYTPPMEGK